MRWRPWIWAVLGLLVVTICYMWRKSPVTGRSTVETGSISNAPTTAVVRPMVLLSQPTNAASTNQNPRLAHRLRNTTKTVGQLAREDHAILLENALIDTQTGS